MSLFISTHSYVSNNMYVYNGSRQTILPDLRFCEFLVSRIDLVSMSKDFW